MKPVTNDLLGAVRKLTRLVDMQDATAEQKELAHDIRRLIGRALYWVTKDRPQEIAEVNRHICENLGESIEWMPRPINGKRDADG